VLNAGNENSSAAPFLDRCSGSKKIVGFEARRFGILKAAGGDEFRDEMELFEQRIIELSTALIRPASLRRSTKR